MDERLSKISEIFDKFGRKEEFLCLGLADNQVFMFADKSRDPKLIMSVLAAAIANDEWLRMVIMGSLLGVMAEDPKLKAEFLGVVKDLKDGIEKTKNAN